MQLRLFTCSLFMAMSLLVAAQNPDSLNAFNAERLELNKIGMTVLGSWAIGNMAVSALSLKSSQGNRRSFHQMNIGWNAVNLAIAGFGYYGAVYGNTDLGLTETIQEHESIKRILLFNAGLDLAYMAGGAYLLERAKNDSQNAHRFAGFGRAVIMNGAFLFTFDLVMFYLHQQHGAEALYPALEQVNINLGLQGFSLRWSF